jgi:type IV pilus assembly protein PilE
MGGTDERQGRSDERRCRPFRAGAGCRENVAMRAETYPRRAGQAGFTLTELMIVIVVLGLLAAVALPSFVDAIRKSRRAEAFNALATVQQAQERWRGTHASYADTLGEGSEEDPGLNLPDQTPGGYYTVAIASADANGYVLVATGNDDTTQAGDAQCRRLAMRMQGGNLQYAGCGSCEDFSFAATHPCWAR